MLSCCGHWILSDQYHFTLLEFKAIQTFNGGEEGNLRFDEGDMVLVYWAHDNGWWYGAAGDNQGWFPGSFLEVSKTNLQFIVCNHILYAYFKSHRNHY